MPEWTVLGLPGADRPHALTNDQGARIEPPRDPSTPPPDRAREVPLGRFPADRQDDAVHHFMGMVRDGFKGALPIYMTRKERLWRHRGGPHYLNQQVFRLRVPQLTVDKCRHNQELFRMTALLNQLTERYHKSRKEHGVAVLPPIDLSQIRQTLVEAAKDRSRLHALAAASDEMLTEAYAAFGIEEPTREYWVHCIYDEKPEPPAETAPQPVGGTSASRPGPAIIPPPGPAESAPDPSPLPPKPTAPLAGHHPHRPKQHSGAK